MAIKYFGQDFSYDFYPLTPSGFGHETDLPAAPVSVYIYDGYPSEGDAAAGTTNDGSYTVVEGPIVAWTDTPDSKGKRIQFTAIDKPADLADFYKKYYIVINTALDNAISPVIREVTLQKLRAQESIIDVTVSDILVQEPVIAIEFPSCMAELDQYIDGATEEVKYILNGCKRDFADFTNPGVLNRAVVKLAISNFYFGQSRDVRDIHYANGLRFKEDFSEALKRINLEFDDDRDGKPDGKVSAPKGVRTIRVLR